jgi:hypothetical protein
MYYLYNQCLQTSAGLKAKQELEQEQEQELFASKPTAAALEACCAKQIHNRSAQLLQSAATACTPHVPPKGQGGHD